VENRKVFYVPTLLLVLFCMNTSFAATTITPDNSNIQYTGRIDFSVPAAPVFGWPGGQILVNFQGTSVKATFTNQGDGDGNTFWAAIIDDGSPVILEYPAGTSTATIATGLSDTTHKLLLHRRSEASDGTNTFLGLELDDGRGLLTPPAKPEKKIEFYGDSITVGMGLDDPGSATENDTTNNYMAYGAQTARNLDMEYHCQAVSGIGLVGGWGQMSNVWDLTNPADAGSTWDFNQWVPDVIVQNLGQNDQWQATPSAAEAIQGYVDYVLMYRGAYGSDVPIVLAIGSMQASQAGSPWPGYIQSPIDTLQSTYNDYKVSKCIFPYDGLGTHPHLPEHIAMADQLTSHIQIVLECGDGQCSENENSCTCPDDCGPPESSEIYCGDGVDDDCDGAVDCFDTECEGDPACPGYCGNGLCDPLENCNTCPDDCIKKTTGPPNRRYCCGDGVCEGDENGTNCGVDCGGTYCGDGTCDAGEDSSNCPSDCGGSYCGDETCDPGEDQCNCPDDCGTPPSTETSCTDGIDNDCDTYTDCDDSDCDDDPACIESYCGDGTCDPDEDQCNCPEDCGTPPSTETSCTDGIDNDCDNYTDCDDSDCDGDPACPDCLPKNAPCTDNADCCSGNCRPSGKCA